MANIREYKSSVFSMLMEDPKNCLQVYNALNNSNYDDPNEVVINRLENGIVLTIRNDASFIIDMYLSIMEQQSTYNPNMPLRSLIYYIDIIKPIVVKKDLYSRKKIIIPTPKFVVFYNGLEERPKIEELYLSSAFSHEQKQPELELKCTVYNINKGSNNSFMGNCKILREYMVFVDKIRYNISMEMELKEAIDTAISDCLEQGILAEFLTNRGNEVRQVAALDYTFERREQLFRAEEHEAGRAEGLKEGKAEGLKEGKAEGIRCFIIDKLEDEVCKDKIIEKLIRIYGLDKDLAEKYYAECLEE